MRCFANVTSCHGHPTTKFIKISYTFGTKRTMTLLGDRHEQMNFSHINIYLSRFLFVATSSALPADCGVTGV